MTLCLLPSADPSTPFTSAEEDVANGDLPADIHVLPAGAECDEDDANSDEGRAMMQIVHDVAPGASLSFSSGYHREREGFDFDSGFGLVKAQKAVELTGASNEAFAADEARDERKSRRLMP